MPTPTKPTSLGQFGVAVIVVLAGFLALGVVCLAIALRANANADAAGQLMRVGGALIATSLGAGGVVLAVKRWLG